MKLYTVQNLVSLDGVQHAGKAHKRSEVPLLEYEQEFPGAPLHRR